MRARDFLPQKLYYHGSSDPLPVGTILTPRDDYEERWGRTDFYKPLELYRPKNMLSHRQSVFMCDNEDDVSIAGGYTDYLLTVEPVGPVQRHDLNWSSEISALIGDGHDIRSPKVKEAADKYWQGIPFPNEQVWEYLTPRARVVKVEEYQ